MKKKAQTGLKILLVVLGLILVISAILTIVAITSEDSNNSITGNVINTFRNCEEIQVPYQEIETYTEREPYESTEYYDYYLQAQVINSYKQERLELSEVGYYEEANVDLKNVDTESGWFIVTFNWKTLNKEWKEEVRHFVEPDETIRFTSTYDKTMGEDNKFTYTYTSEPIEKSRVVTKYRDAEKTRTITKYRTEERCE